MRRAIWTASGLAIVLALGCGSDAKKNAGDNDAQPSEADAGMADGAAPGSDTGQPTETPAASFKALSKFDALQGQVQVEVEASASANKVELLAGDKVVAAADAAPFTIAWDTTGTDDGIVSVKLRAHAGDQMADSDALDVILYNNGEEASYINANETTMAIIGDHTHVKTHWIMPEAITRVIAVLYWDEPAFEMDIAIGIGTCPHSGTEAKREAGDTSPIAVDFASQGLLTEGQWFAHMSATNEDEVSGQSTKLRTRVYLLR